MRKPVLTIFYQFNPWQSTIGGIQTVISLFIKYAPSEFEVKLVGTGNNSTQTIGKWQENELAGRSVKFFPLFKLQDDNVRRLVPTTINYTTALMRHSFASDFMHFHRLEPTLAALRWQGDKTLFIHNDIQTQMKATDNKKAILWRRFPAAYFALEGLLVKQFTQIFSCNTESLKLYQQRYPAIADRVAYIRNTVDNEIFYPLDKQAREAGRRKLAQQQGLPEDTKFVLFAGRLHPQKDPVLLVRAFAQLQEANAHLLIAGDGELATEVRSEINQLGLTHKITMLGALNQAQLADLHRVCNIFILTSAYEGLPLVVLEALACGTPVVTTRCGETPKLLAADSGVVSSERTASCIAEALSQVLLKPDSYPIESCVRAAQPYNARTVVTNAYNEMWHRWEQRLLTSK